MLTTILILGRDKYKVAYDISRLADEKMIYKVDGTDVCELEEDLVLKLECILVEKLNELFPDELG